ncbi:MAG: aldo/keto reductase [Alistipes indistinctus]
MRWPTRPRSDGKGDEVDQETVNELVDYAIGHGVNYFDTSPVYVQGLSNGRPALHLGAVIPATNISWRRSSNFSNYTRENSLAMYRRSLEELQTDYFDYYLPHSVGGGTGIPLVRARYFDNGMMDFLLREREAGRVRNLGWSFHGDVRVFDYMLSLDIPWDFVQIQMNYADWRHAQGRNVNAEYLYGELEKRNIPVVIMEPLLGDA